MSGAKGDRTPDLLAASQTLSQLSYGPGDAPRLAWRHEAAAARRGRVGARGVRPGAAPDAGALHGARGAGTTSARAPDAARQRRPGRRRPPDGVMSDGTKLAYTLVLPGRLRCLRRRTRCCSPSRPAGRIRRPPTAVVDRRLEAGGEEARLDRRLAGRAGRAVLRPGVGEVRPGAGRADAGDVSARGRQGAPGGRLERRPVGVPGRARPPELYLDLLDLPGLCRPSRPTTWRS